MTTATVRTPTVRAWWRRTRFWAGAAALVIVIALVSILLGGTGEAGDERDPTNPAPIGSKALAEVLRQQGVEVVLADERQEVEAALTDDVPAALLIDDWLGVLGTPSLEALGRLDATRVLLVDPTGDALDAFLPGVRRAGVTSNPAPAAECALPAARGIAISGRATLFQTTDDATACYPTDAGLARLVVTPTATAIGMTALLTNEHILDDGNAALALRLLGAEPRLVWYRPSLADADIEIPPTIGDLSPGWVVPAALLLIVTFVAAVVWRGRRLGPLVVEPLPSIVPADETVRGRARLYARGRSRLRAADALRLGTLDRIGTDLGLPPSAGIDAIVLATAALTSRPAEQLRALLVDEQPDDDTALLRIAADLTALEHEVAQLIRPPQAGE